MSGPDRVDFPGLVTALSGLSARAGDGRQVTALAGPPGAGKSTIAERLAAALDAAGAGPASVLPMDGFHYDDVVLDARGLRSRKGAPHTFDVGGLAAVLSRIAANAEPEIAVPVFDREIEIARAAARVIPAAVRHVIVEGNWLLLDTLPWSDLAPFYDTTIFIDVPMDEIAARLERRWAGLPPDALRAKMEENDLPNARTCIGESRQPDYVLDNADGHPA